MLTLKDCEIGVIATMDDIPVRGNASVSGDDVLDKRSEDAILDRLKRGDVWAWASVEVRVSFGQHHASEYLGACSYEDEADFQAEGGYFDEMRSTALEDLNNDLLEKALRHMDVFHVPLADQTSETVYWNEDDGEPCGEGWFYWFCFGGCMPEHEPRGPFETEDAAVKEIMDNWLESEAW